VKRSQRVIWSDNGTLKDISASVSEFRTAALVIPFVAAEDAIYIGTELPFNHKHFELGSAVNATTTAPTVQIWRGNAWVATKDLQDETKTSPFAAISLAQSGQISFATDIQNSGWTKQQISNDVTGLSGTYVYDMYWTKWTWSADWTATTAISYIGHLFSDDNDLLPVYPDFKNTALKSTFEAGKTTWREQAILAAESMVAEMKERGLINRPEQIQDTSLLKEASVHKTAYIIYSGLGSAHAAAKASAGAAYSAAMKMKFPEVDKNGDGQVSAAEKCLSTAYMTR
jgi:hypothetical protein